MTSVDAEPALPVVTGWSRFASFFAHAKAAHAKSEAARHEKMAQSYSQGKSLERLKMQSHCKRIAKSLTKEADDYSALAKLHEEEASKKK